MFIRVRSNIWRRTEEKKGQSYTMAYFKISGGNEEEGLMEKRLDLKSC